jgi:phosphoserine aminotransferase
MSRAWNFSAGPAALPAPVLEELREVLLEFSDCQAGIMEISHRSAQFGGVMRSAQDRLRRVLAVPDDYAVLFLQGGASLQFYMAPLNLCGPDDAMAMVDTGSWSSKALVEARRCCGARTAFSGRDSGYGHAPAVDEFSPAALEGATYLHYCSNNTIRGTQFATTPQVDLPLVADLSSDVASRPVDVARHAVIYAGAQKNLGPSGVTAVIASPWAIERSRAVATQREGGLPSMLNYALQADKNSMFNTPNTWGIFVLERVLAWAEDQGGAAVIGPRNRAKADLLYGELDRTEFWSTPVRKDSRSDMNVVWRLPTEDLDKRFVSEATAAGLLALKGHRDVGGIRASLYNAMPIEGVQALVAFMGEFERANG